MRRVWALFLAVIALVLVGAGPAAAEDPVRLDTQVTDLVGALPADRPGVDQALSPTADRERHAALRRLRVHLRDGHHEGLGR